MPDLILTPRSGLERFAIPGRYGRAEGEAGVMLALRTDFALATVMARSGQERALAERAGNAFGLDLPLAPRRAASGAIAFVWAGASQWLAVAEGFEGRAFETRLRAELTNLASVADQSDGRTIVRVSGPKARDALAKGVMIDLDPRAFAPGDAAVSSVAHIGVHFWQIDAAPTYDFAIFRSFAGSFWEWLTASAAEFGVTVTDSRP